MKNFLLSILIFVASIVQAQTILQPKGGGTGNGSYTSGDILYATAVGTLSKLPVGSGGQVLTVLGGLPSWQAAGGGSGWSLTGNSGTVGSNFLGTTDNKSLRFRTNNTQKAILDSNGRMGINVLSPTEKLDLSGNFRIRLKGTINSDSALSIKTSGVQRMYIGNDAFGFVGIGVPNPDNMLQVWELIDFDAGNRNCKLGDFNGHSITTAHDNTLIGSFVGQHIKDANNNTYINGAGNYQVHGAQNIGIGVGCLYSDSLSSDNLAIGVSALHNTKAPNNIGIGSQAGYSNTTGTYMIAHGLNALYNSSIGDWQIGEGGYSLYSNTGTKNIAIGINTLYSNVTGNYNTVLGNAAGQNVTGSSNIFLGYNAALSCTNLSNKFVLANKDLGDNGTTARKAPLYINLGSDSTDNTIRVNGTLQISDGTQSSGKIFTSDANGIGSWATPTNVVISHNDLTSQTNTVSVTSYTTTSDGTFRVGGYVNTTAITTDVAQLQVTYTDENSTPQTEVFSSNALSGSISSVGNFPMLSMDIRVKSGTVITIKVALTTSIGSITYDVGGNITKLY